MRLLIALLCLSAFLLAAIRLIRWRLGHFRTNWITEEELAAEREYLGEMPSPLSRGRGE